MKTLLSFILTSAIISCGLYSIVQTIQADTPYKIPRDCSCDCFDRKIKGTYFDEQYQYRSIYFNLDDAILYIFIWSLFYILLLMKFVEKVLTAIFYRKLEIFAFILGSVSLFSHFFNWWVTFNYLNDRFYRYFYSQMFFSVTELLPGYCIYLLLDGTKPNFNISNISLGILLMHVYQSLSDQGLRHLFLNDEFEFHTFVRDALFLFADGSAFVVIAKYKEWQLEDALRVTNFGLMSKIFFNFIVGFYE
eukprot:NODE_132_length_16614_cov_0.935392.p8 type:complete len:248 gc:universal NODE_132_length_16614_cov_0.935392:9315-8572(-)